MGSDFDLEREQMSRLNREQEHELEVVKKKVSTFQQENA